MMLTIAHRRGRDIRSARPNEPGRPRWIRMLVTLAHTAPEVGRAKVTEHADHRGLPGSVWAEQAEYLSLAYVDGHVIDCADVSGVHLRQITSFNDLLQGAPPLRSSCLSWVSCSSRIDFIIASYGIDSVSPTNFENSATNCSCSSRVSLDIPSVT